MGVSFKICGLTREADLAAAVEAGASHVGVIVVPGTPRYVTPYRAASLLAQAPSGVSRVLVAGDLTLDELREIAAIVQPDIIQLHRNEPPEYVRALGFPRIWRAFSLRTQEDLLAARQWKMAEAIVADTGNGGSGIPCDWSLAAQLIRERPVVLAGGITPENVRAAVAATGATMVDCSSGVESSPGIKDRQKIFALAAALAEAEIQG